MSKKSLLVVIVVIVFIVIFAFVIGFGLISIRIFFIMISFYFMFIVKYFLYFGFDIIGLIFPTISTNASVNRQLVSMLFLARQ